MAEGLLSGAFESPLTNLGIGLLAASGPSMQPVSFGQALGQGFQFAQNAQQQAMRNRVVRSRLEDDARKRSATQKLTGLLGDQGNPAIGLLAEIAPNAFAQGLIGQMFPEQRSETSLVRNLKAAGIDPSSEEGQGIIRKNLLGQNTTDQLDQMLKTLQVQNIVAEREAANTEKQQKNADAKIGVLGGIDRLKEIADINNRLSGTLGETGMGLDDLRNAVAGPASLMKPELRQTAADMQRLEQLTTNEAVQSLFGSEVSAGTLTNQKLSTFLKTKPGANRLPEVNNRIIADMMQSKLDSAEKLGIAVPDKEEVRNLIKTLRAPAQKRQAGQQQSAPAKIIDFNSLPDK